MRTRARRLGMHHHRTTLTTLTCVLTCSMSLCACVLEQDTLDEALEQDAALADEIVEGAALDAPDGAPLVPEPDASSSSSDAEDLEQVEMCGIEACPASPSAHEMDLHGPEEVLPADYEGPASFSGGLLITGGPEAVRAYEIPSRYADVTSAEGFVRDDQQEQDPQALQVLGYGHYCSVTWPSGHWAMAWDTGEYSDPCGWLNPGASGATINRAGVFSRSGMNTAIVRCDNGAGAAYHGYGTGPLAAAFDASTQYGPAGCKMTVGPAHVPLFTGGPIRSGGTSRGTGFDFARDEYLVIPSQFGQSGNWFVGQLNQLGKGKSGFINNHDGHDFNGTESDIAVALGSGFCFEQRWFDTNSQPNGSTGEWQGESYMRHQLNRIPSTYTETWVVAYFHMDSIYSRKNKYVYEGTWMGSVGSRGSSNTPHVHMDVMKLSNPVWGDDRFYDFEILPGPGGVAHNGGPVKVDPHGFSAPLNIDPWAWRSPAPNGAISSNLWATGDAPAHGNWGL